jgi:hypothetical protein
MKGKPHPFYTQNTKGRLKISLNQIDYKNYGQCRAE